MLMTRPLMAPKEHHIMTHQHVIGHALVNHVKLALDRTV